jgi:hypothetical protein
MAKRKLVLPKKIAVPEIILFIFNPLFLFVLLATGLVNIIVFPLSYLSLTILLFTGALLLLARNVFLEILFDNLILLYALIGFLFGRRYVTWQKTKVQN